MIGRHEAREMLDLVESGINEDSVNKGQVLLALRASLRASLMLDAGEPGNCEDCGTPLSGGEGRFCPECLPGAMGV